MSFDLDGRAKAINALTAIIVNKPAYEEDTMAMALKALNGLLMDFRDETSWAQEAIETSKAEQLLHDRVRTLEEQVQQAFAAIHAQEIRFNERLGV